MPYFRIDLDGKDGEHLAIFADANSDGTIFQQFCIGLDGDIEDLEHCRLTTVFDYLGHPIERVSAKLGWRRISGDEWEKGVEIKRVLYARDCALQRLQRPPCGLCGGTGKLASTGKVCRSCMGSGRIK